MLPTVNNHVMEHLMVVLCSWHHGISQDADPDPGYMYAYSTQVENLAEKKSWSRRREQGTSRVPCAVFNEAVCMYCSARLGTRVNWMFLHGDVCSGWCYAEEGLLIGGGMTDTHGSNYEDLVFGGNRLLLSMCDVFCFFWGLEPTYGFGMVVVRMDVIARRGSSIYGDIGGSKAGIKE